MTDRHQCEVRHVLCLRAMGGQKANQYLEAVEKRRGKETVAKLRGDCAEQWVRGNRGQRGVWIENKNKE
ncbi:MAG: hypothetical protein JWR21_910 [Herminiimonas sp.]|nr:hypothetical protein [Herminiimonas sp.]